MVKLMTIKLLSEFKLGIWKMRQLLLNSECLHDIMHWMNQKKLKMNNSKSEIILYGTKPQLSKVNISSVNVGGIEEKCVQAARIVANSSSYRPSDEILKSLHWLPVKARIMFKILVTVFRVVQGTAPIYLSSMFKRAQGHYRLRSSNEIRFTVPRTRTRTVNRSIAVVGPKWWNTLPNDIKTCTNETTENSFV